MAPAIPISYQILFKEPMNIELDIFDIFFLKFFRGFLDLILVCSDFLELLRGKLNVLHFKSKNSQYFQNNLENILGFT